MVTQTGIGQPCQRRVVGVKAWLRCREVHNMSKPEGWKGGVDLRCWSARVTGMESERQGAGRGSMIDDSGERDARDQTTGKGGAPRAKRESDRGCRVSCNASLSAIRPTTSRPSFSGGPRAEMVKTERMKKESPGYNSWIFPATDLLQRGP